MIQPEQTKNEKRKSDFYLFCFREEQQKVDERKCENLWLLFGIAGCICLTSLIGIPPARSVIHLEWNSFFHKLNCNPPPLSIFNYKLRRSQFHSEILKNDLGDRNLAFAEPRFPRPKKEMVKNINQGLF